MKRSGFVLIIMFVLAASLIGCNAKSNEAPSADQTKPDNGEAQKVAQKIADLTVSKCGDKYFIADGRYAKTLTVTVEPRELAPGEHFHGYQWEGEAVLSSVGVTERDSRAGTVGGKADTVRRPGVDATADSDGA